jgi:hypothetical protein
MDDFPPLKIPPGHVQFKSQAKQLDLNVHAEGRNGEITQSGQIARVSGYLIRRIKSIVSPKSYPRRHVR